VPLPIFAGSTPFSCQSASTRKILKY
jgi:hypothetical protein